MDMTFHKATAKEWLNGDKGVKAVKGGRGEQKTPGVKGSIQVDTNGHLTASPDGIRVSSTNIETAAVTVDIMNTARITACNISAPIMTVQQGTSGRIEKKNK